MFMQLSSLLVKVHLRSVLRLTNYGNDIKASGRYFFKRLEYNYS